MDALQINGTLMGDHRCERTALGISEPTGTDPILAANVPPDGAECWGRARDGSHNNRNLLCTGGTFGVGARCCHDFRIGIPLIHIELQSMLDPRWRSTAMDNVARSPRAWMARLPNANSSYPVPNLHTGSLEPHH